MSTDREQTTLPPLPTDLPARIRDVLAHGGTLSDSTALAAASEIERLRAAVAVLSEFMDEAEVADTALHRANPALSLAVQIAFPWR